MSSPFEENKNTSGNAWSNEPFSPSFSSDNQQNPQPIDPNWQIPNQTPPQWQNEQPPQGEPQWQSGQPGQNYSQPWPNQPYYQMPSNQKSRVIAGLLGVLLGGLGIHRFYLGYTGIGIAQILVTVFTLGLGSLWGFIEGIMILVGTQSFQTDANGVPLAN